MSTIHRYSTATENHRLPGFEFASLSAAQSHVYASSDVSFMVRVGTPPYTYYIISQVVAGVATLLPVGGIDDYVDVWNPSAANAASDGLHAHTDEFLGSVIDPAWATWDHGGVFTFAANPERKRVTIATALTATRAGGLYKAIPDTEFSFLAEGAALACGATNTSTMDWGIMLGADLSVTTSDLVSIRVTGRIAVQAGTQTQHDTFSVAGTAYATKSVRFVRMRVNGTTVHFDSSENGLDWERMHSMTVGFTPVHYGIIGGCRMSAAGTPGVASIHCFRVLAGAGSSAQDALIPGRLVRLPVA